MKVPISPYVASIVPDSKKRPFWPFCEHEGTNLPVRRKYRAEKGPANVPNTEVRFREYNFS